MADVEFSYITSAGQRNSIVVDEPTRVTWNLPATGAPGEATVELPVNSPALSSTYISLEGYSWIKVLGGTEYGDWSGYITRIEEGLGKTIIYATEWWGILHRIPVGFNRNFRHVTPAVIVKAAMSASPWTISEAVETYPDIPEYEFNGEAIWDHIQQMMQLSGMEIYYESNYIWKWGRLESSTDVTGIFTAPVDIVDAKITRDSSRMANNVMAVSGLDWYIARGNNLAVQSTSVVKEQLTPAGLGATAENELLRASRPERTITAGLTRDNWSKNVGDSFSVFVPYAAFGEGRIYPVRVVSKTKTDDRELVDVTLQIVENQPIVGLPRLNKLSGLWYEGMQWRRRSSRYLAGTFEGRNI